MPLPGVPAAVLTLLWTELGRRGDRPAAPDPRRERNGMARGIPQLTTVVCLALAVFSAPVVDIDGTSMIRLGAGSYLLRMLRTAHSH